MHHPFADLIGLVVTQQRAGYSECSLALEAKHMNPHGVVHGAVVYALADTGMGAAAYPTLAPGELCATLEIKITYFKPARSGELRCITTLVNRSKTLANFDAMVYCGEVLLAKANGNYAIFTPSAGTVKLSS